MIPKVIQMQWRKSGGDRGTIVVLNTRSVTVCLRDLVGRVKSGHIGLKTGGHNIKCPPPPNILVPKHMMLCIMVRKHKMIARVVLI